MAKIFLHALSILKMHMTEFLGINFWKVLWKYGIDGHGHLLLAIKSFYCRLEVCVQVNGKQSKPFHVSVALQQGCVLSPLFFIVYMNWIDKCSQAGECATITNCKISRLLFADDLVLLFLTESGLQHALNSFADACDSCDSTGMKISIGVDFGGAKGRRPLGSSTEGGEIMSAPLGFLASNTHLAIRNPKFRTEIDPECSKDLFFGHHLNLGAKFRTEIGLLSLTKLCKNILPPRNLLNQQKIVAYENKHNQN